ncbi:MAG TPA: uroporphyrinogen-III C-methyltransferase [Chthoniobacterales bacterium]|jgi:uroporphyrinogen III methyltransferase/synthase|nr:uroporphyrinogen-III C-methyltransferase [Chthoniobacterales bacterium]
MAEEKGICFLVGAGPGDPGLVTLRARQCIEEAEVIVYDYLCNPELLRWAPEKAELIFAGKKAGEHTLSQDEINGLLVEKTGSGKKVVRLKGGDPFLFGRGGEEAQALTAAGLRFVIVPGVTSAIAGPAYAGIPVTHRGKNSHVTFFTGHEDPDKSESLIDLGALTNLGGTQVMLMGVERIGTIARQMIAAGARPDLPVALVRWATTGRHQTLVGTLENIAQRVIAESFGPPAVAVFGDVVSLRKELNWYEDRPLSGKRIVVTRTRAQAGVLTDQLRDLGADVIELPTIRIDPPSDLRAFAELVQDAHAYDWIVFTSPNGVNAFFELFYKLYDDAREIGGARIAAIGPATAQRIKDFHLRVDLQPEEFVAESLVRAFKKEGGVENLRILIARAEKARDLLPTELSALGAIVDEGFAYRTVPETRDDTGARRRLIEEGADLITFTSSSTVENFLALGLPWPPQMQVASIGPITSKTARDRGLEVAVEARRHDIPGLVEAVRKFFTKGR